MSHQGATRGCKIKKQTNKKNNNPHFPLFVVSVEHFPAGFMGSAASLRSY